MTNDINEKEREDGEQTDARDESREQAEDKAASVSKIGKFNSADELLSAYNALQSEFTKRCQLVKQLQAELDACAAQAESPSVTSDEAQNDVSTLPDAAEFAECEGGDDDYAARLAAIPEVMEACIARYKQKLIESRVSPSPSGVAVIVPAKRPKTLSEAKRLADELLAKI